MGTVCYRSSDAIMSGQMASVEFKLGMGTGNIYEALALESDTGGSNSRWG